MSRDANLSRQPKPPMRVVRAKRLLIPRGWTKSVNSTIVRAIALAQLALTTARSRSKQEVSAGRFEQELALVREELRLIKARLERVAPHKRPHYAAVERLAILELQAARGWNAAETARRFLVTPETLHAWHRRIDDGALVQTTVPVNKFPELVRYAIQRLKVLCPWMGTRKIARMLCRAGLHLGATTVRRMLNQPPTVPPRASGATDVVVVASTPNEIWHVDLTTVPTGGGFCLPWLPFSLPQRWPFGWWVAVVVDHFSRQVVGFAVFDKQPRSIDVRGFLGRAVVQVGAPPDTLICDQGSQFLAEGFQKWCRRREIRLRYGAVGKQGSLAVVERFIRTLKTEGTRKIMVALERHKFRKQLSSFITWYNHHRPHTTLGGKTPDEVYFDEFPANRKPRLEPRPNWPRGSPCAKPQTLVAGQPGDEFQLVVKFQDGERHLPIFSLKRVAA